MASSIISFIVILLLKFYVLSYNIYLIYLMKYVLISEHPKVIIKASILFNK